MWGNTVQSHQSKGLSNMATLLVLWLRELCGFNNITKSNVVITIKYDNSGLCKIKANKMNEKTPDANAICLIHYIAEDIPGNVIHYHINGHQNRKAKKKSLP